MPFRLGDGCRRPGPTPRVGVAISSSKVFRGRSLRTAGHYTRPTVQTRGADLREGCHARGEACTTRLAGRSTRTAAEASCRASRSGLDHRREPAVRDARVPPGRCAPDGVSCRVSRSLESDAHSSGMTQHDVNEHTRLERDQTVATERRVWTVGEAARSLGSLGLMPTSSSLEASCHTFDSAAGSLSPVTRSRSFSRPEFRYPRG